MPSTETTDTAHRRASADPSATDAGLLQRIAAPACSPSPVPRLLVVLAHPDDEVLALGARLERLAASRLLTVTDGAPGDGADARAHGFGSLDNYRAARQSELIAALHHAGLRAEIAAPIAGASPIPVPDQTAALHLTDLTRAVAAAILGLAPQAVLTHPYEGGHPDHDACAFAVHAAVQLLRSNERATSTAPLLILEAPFYHSGPGGSMATGTFLNNAGESRTIICPLSAQEQANKRARLACFASQAETLAQFDVDREIFRHAPRYDFTTPPHSGQLFYERFLWGMTGERFRALAADALATLFGTSHVSTRSNQSLQSAEGAAASV